MAGFCISGFPIQRNPYPPNSVIPPTPSVLRVGTGGNGSSFSGPPGFIPVNFNQVGGINPVFLGDLLIGIVAALHAPGSPDITDWTGGLPPGWTLIRNDVNPGGAGSHGPMCTAVCYKFAGIAELGLPVINFSLSNAGATDNGGYALICNARNSLGVENIAVFMDQVTTSGGLGHIIAPAVATPQSIELVFTVGMWGSSGTGIFSDNSLSPAVVSSLNPSGVGGIGGNSAAYYGFSAGATYGAQPLTVHSGNTIEAFTAYQISVKGGPP